VEFRLHHHVGDYRKIEATLGKLCEGPAAQIVLICRDAARRKSPLLSISMEERGATPDTDSVP
jgi:hypothetical protein